MAYTLSSGGDLSPQEWEYLRKQGITEQGIRGIIQRIGVDGLREILRGTGGARVPLTGSPSPSKPPTPPSPKLSPKDQERVEELKDEMQKIKENMAAVGRSGQRVLEKMLEERMKELKELLGGAPMQPTPPPTNEEREYDDWEPEVEVSNLTDSVFRSRLGSIMHDNKFDRVLPKRKKGKLDTKNLWKARVGQENVFRQKQERKNKAYSVVLLVDESGSMRYDDKIDRAAELADFMAASFDGLNIRFSILGFNERMIVHKTFEQPYKQIKSRLQTEMQKEVKNPGIYTDKRGGQNYYSQGNHDYGALEEAYKTLAKETHGKLLIVFSDGRPHCDHPDACGYDQKKHAFNHIKALVHANTDVATIGVGIQDSSVTEIYPTAIVVNNLGEFKGKVLAELKKHIKRG